MKKKIILSLVVIAINILPVSCMETNDSTKEGFKSVCEQAQEVISECIGNSIFIKSCGEGRDASRIIKAKDCEEVLKILRGG